MEQVRNEQTLYSAAVYCRLSKDDDLADARMEQIFAALENRDEEMIKSTFSQKALLEAKNLDENIDKVFSFVQGKLSFWKRDESPVVFDNSENVGKTKRLLTWYTLHTDEQSYLIFLADYPIDTIEPKNEGLYTFKILEEKNENKLKGSIEDWIIPGIDVLDD